MGIDYQVSVYHTLSMICPSVDTMRPRERGTFSHALLGWKSHGYACVRDEPCRCGPFRRVATVRAGKRSLRPKLPCNGPSRVDAKHWTGLAAVGNDIGQFR
jgi:hypothetical protein